MKSSFFPWSINPVTKHVFTYCVTQTHYISDRHIAQVIVNTHLHQVHFVEDTRLCLLNTVHYVFRYCCMKGYANVHICLVESYRSMKFRYVIHLQGNIPWDGRIIEEVKLFRPLRTTALIVHCRISTTVPRADVLREWVFLDFLRR